MIKLFHLIYLYALSISIIAYGMEKNESNDSLDHCNRSRSNESAPHLTIAQCQLSQAILARNGEEIKKIYNNIYPDFCSYITYTPLDSEGIELYQKDCPITKAYHDVFVQMKIPYMQDASPYAWAIFIGEQAIVNLLDTTAKKPDLEYHPDISLPCTAHKYTPLHIAAQFQPHLIPYLLAHGADLTALDSEGCCPPMILCTREIASKKLCESFQFLKTEQQRNQAAFHAFTAAGISFNDVIQEGGKTALHVAAWYGKEDIIDLLLNKKVEINKPNDEKETAIFFATANKQMAIINKLLDAGAQAHQYSCLKSSNDKLLSILDYIHPSDRAHGNELTRLLVNHGAPFPILNPPKFPLLNAFEFHMAYLSSRYKKYLIALLQKNYVAAKKIMGGANNKELIETDSFSRNPLHWAVMYANRLVVEKILKKAHCLPNKIDKKFSRLAPKPLTLIYQQCDNIFHTPLMWAQTLEKNDITDLLSKAGATK